MLREFSGLSRICRRTGGGKVSIVVDFEGFPSLRRDLPEIRRPPPVASRLLARILVQIDTTAERHKEHYGSMDIIITADGKEIARRSGVARDMELLEGTPLRVPIDLESTPEADGQPGLILDKPTSFRAVVTYRGPRVLWIADVAFKAWTRDEVAMWTAEERRTWQGFDHPRQRNPGGRIQQFDRTIYPSLTLPSPATRLVSYPNVRFETRSYNGEDPHSFEWQWR